LAQGQPGAIFNYRTIWKNAQSAPKELIDQPRVQDFCSAHRDFWLEVERKRTSHKPSVLFKTEFENYYQFFDEMCKFMEEYNSSNHQQWDAAFDTDEAGIKLLDYVDASNKDSLNDEILEDIESLRWQREKLDPLVHRIDEQFLISTGSL
jgi:hypothetical protein